jgi:feruloyl esterase
VKTHRLGQRSVDDFLKLYIIPGMGHCEGGFVPNDIGQTTRPGADAKHSVLKAVEEWVEEKSAPDCIIATQWKVDDPTSGVDRQQPICPHAAIIRK